MSMVCRIVGVVVLAVAPLAGARQLSASAPQGTGHDGGQVHRLDFAASYLEEAEACDIPDATSEIVRGTMRLAPTRTDNHDARRVFAVRDVNWLVASPHGGRIIDETLVTGHGLYTLTNHIGDATIPGHRLVLDLRIDDEFVRFDSGLIPHANAPLDIIVREVNKDYLCVRRSFRVASSPVSRGDVHPFVMGDTAYFAYQPSQAGPLSIVPIGGGFGLVELPIEPNTPAPGGLTEWALVDLRANGGGDPGDSPPVGIRGAGVYQHFTATFTGEPAHLMHAEFAIRGPFAPADGLPIRFESGLAGSGWNGPTHGEPLPFFHIPLDDTDPHFPLWRVNVVAGALPLNP